MIEVKHIDIEEVCRETQAMIKVDGILHIDESPDYEVLEKVPVFKHGATLFIEGMKNPMNCVGFIYLPFHITCEAKVRRLNTLIDALNDLLKST